MGEYTLVSASSIIEDAALLARNNAAAFWQQPWWRMLRGSRTQESLALAMESRLPWNLVRQRAVQRHQRVVYTLTGDIVGYARWILPESLASEWTSAQVPEVPEASRSKFELLYEQADFHVETDTSVLDPPVYTMMDTFRPKEPHISNEYYQI